MNALKNWKQNSKLKLRGKKGYTLLELLITVGIIAVVVAVAIVAIVAISRSIRQKELDSKAEIIFAAAQARLTDLNTAGREDIYYSGEGVTKLGILPKDAPEGTTLDSNSIYFVKSLDNSGTSVKKDSTYAVSFMLPASYVDQELWGNNWIIEYDRENAIVYGVFYTESDDDFVTNYSSASDSYRDRSVRMSNGARVGYYGGNEAHTKKANRKDYANYLTTNLSLVVVNGEKLIVKMACNSPNSMALKFYVNLSDTSGHTVTKTLDGKLTSSDYYTYDYVLDVAFDDVTSGEEKFANMFPSLTPGQDITISVTVMTASSSEYDPGTKTATTNSLFDSITSSAEALAAANNDASRAEKDTAVVTYGRHLENLSQTSGVSSSIKYAVQRSDIELAESTATNKPIDDWYAYYGSEGKNFVPINNTNLLKYSVDSYVSYIDEAKTISETVYYIIHGMQIDETESGASAGMFGKFNGTRISNVNLVGAKVSGGDKAASGTLVGIAGSNAVIEDCHVYLSQADITTMKGNRQGAETSLVIGSVTGGLIGEVAAEVTIDRSSVSTIVGSSSSEYSGGLVGLVMQYGAKLNINQCYTDSYIYGKISGGLVGSGSVESIANSYAVSYIRGTTQSAGFVNGAVGSATSSYSACTIMDGAMGNRYTTAESISTVNKVFYSTNGTKNVDGTQLKSSEDMSNKVAFIQELGATEGVFTASCGINTDAHPYNLQNQGLTDYSYPRLSNFDHYGDWSAGLKSGTFVYYEKYSDGTYGFYGGNTSALKSDVLVVGDGYGIIYTEDPSNSDNYQTYSVSYQTGLGSNGKEEMSDAVQIKPDEKLTITVGNTNYYVVPLTKTISDSAYKSSNFYHKIEITRNGASKETYFYNPHLAYTQTQVDDMPESVPELITIRSARQLYDLSLEYEYYYSKAGNVLFQQEADIDYIQYDWENYTSEGEKITSQGPIGVSAEIPFASSYNGYYHTITNVSFIGNVETVGDVTTDKVNVGLFGYNKGTLKNIFVVCEYTDDGTYKLQYTGGAKLGKNITMGVIAGVNQGSISNCASAGYVATISAYESSSVKIGGLVGYNYGGRIENCSADCPKFTAGATSATVYIGGFCGHNAGVITSSYSMTAIRIEESKEDSETVISGFAGINRGIIQSSYCSASLLTSGSATSNGFTSTGGVVRSNCKYLNSGFYNYVGQTDSYVYTDSNGDLATNAEGLENFNAGGFGKVATSGNTLLHNMTPNSTNATYPYGAIVKDENGNFIHFGNWATAADPGTMGVFYWEKEDGGSNNGIHVNFVFYDEDSEGYSSISTLCEMHDDGGAITEYGYGYYYEDDISVSLKTETTQAASINLGSKQSDISSTLETMLSGYVFCAYKTGHESTSTMYMTGTGRNTLWTLTCTQDGSTVSNYFVINPFFGNAIATNNNSSNTTSGPGYSETITKNHLACPYEIRSVKQLQYLNWNYSTKNVTTAVTSSNYKQYPYLQYTVNTDSDVMSASSIYAASPKQYYKQTHDLNMYSNKSGYISNFNPIAGTYVTTKPGTTDNDVKMLTWFGGQYDGQSYTIKNVYIETNYVNVGIFGTTLGAVLKNIIVYGNNSCAVVKRSTDSTPIIDPDVNGAGSYVIGGLAGYAYDYNEGYGDTNGDKVNDAKIENCAISGYKIIDNSTTRLGLAGANIGGLLGVSRVALNQCSSVVDLEINCTHRLGTGSDYNYVSRPFTVGVAASANYVRVGGIVGANRYEVTDCYSGGTITVGAETLAETATNDTKYRDIDSRLLNVQGNKIVADGSENARYYRSTHVFIGGISGSSFCPNFYNIVGSSSSEYGSDGEPTFINCYTYMNFPAISGTIRAISLFGSLADRFCYGGEVTEKNCYYLDTSANVDVSNACKTRFFGKRDSLNEKLKQTANNATGETYKDYMLKGDLRHLYEVFDEAKVGGGDVDADIIPVTYDELAGNSDINKTVLINKKNTAINGNILTLLNTRNTDHESSYAKVTTRETIGGVTSTVNGKYSFGDGNSSLEGQNYPFPTIITQQNTLLDDSTVHVHYGKWPQGTMYFQDGKISFDIFENYNSTDKKSTYGTAVGNKIELKVSGSTLESLKNDPKKLKTRFLNSEGTVITSESSCIEIESITPSYSSGSVYFVVRAKNIGTTYLEAYIEDGSESEKSSVAITVTADAELSVDPGTITDYEESTNTVRLYLKNNNEAFKFGDDTGLTENNLSWTITSGNQDYATVESGVTKTSGNDYYESRITCVGAGNTVIDYVAQVTIDLGTYGERIFEYDTVVAVEVLPVSYIGVGFTGATPYIYNQGAIPTDKTTSEVTGQNKVFKIGSEPYIASASSFLYCKGNMADATRMTITGLSLPDVDITDENGQVVGYNYQYSYSLGTLINQGNYSYYPINVTGAVTYDRTETVVVTVRYQYADGYPAVTYTLTGKCIVRAAQMVSVLLLDYNGNAMLDEVYGVRYGTALNISEISSLILDPRAPIKDGYHNPGDYKTNASRWNTKKDGSGEAMGQELRADTNYYLQLEPNEYTIEFYGNGATGGSMAKVNCVYDENVTLPANTFTYGANVFAGWNTKADGTGDSYTDKQVVKNLTADDDGTIKLYAQWDYSIKYDPNGGTVKTAIADQVKKKGAVITLEDNLDANGNANFIKEGWLVNCWNTKADGTGTRYELGQAYVTDESITLYAQWTEQIFTINYYANYDGGPEKAVFDSVKYKTENYTIKNEKTFARSGSTKYMITSWNTKADGTGDSYDPGEVLDVPVTFDLTLYAQWTEYYIITYYANYAGYSGEPLTQIKLKDENVTLKSNDAFLRNGLVIESWNEAAGGGGTRHEYGSTYTDNKDLNLFVQWAYVITYSANEGQIAAGTSTRQLRNVGKEVTLSDGSGFTRTGYDFVGWNTKSDGSGTAYNPDSSGNPAKYKADSSVTLYAQWQLKTYEIKYHSNYEGSTLPDEVTTKNHFDSTYTLWDGSDWGGTGTGISYTRTGYILNGWNTVASPTPANPGKSYGLTGTTAVYADNADLELFAQWTAVYTITYHINYDDKTDVKTQEKVDGVNINLLLANETGFTRTDWSITSWNTEANGTGTGYELGQAYSIEGNEDLYAIWTEDKFDIIYHSSHESSKDVTQKDEIARGTTTLRADTTGLPANFATEATDAGKHLDGWESADGSQQYELGASVEIGADMDLYAVWVFNEYTVSYNLNANGDTTATGSINSQTKTHGTPITLSDGKDKETGEPAFKRTGYTLKEWNTVASPTDENPGVVYALGGSFSENGQEDKATITLYAQWEKETYPVTYSKGDDTTVTGTVPAAQTKIYGITLTLQDNTDLAKAGSTKTEDITTSFDVNGGDSSDPVDVTSTKTSGTTYEIIGWNTKADGTGTAYKFGSLGGTYAINAGITLYPQWKENMADSTYSSITLPNPGDLSKLWGLIKYTFVGWYTAASGGTLVGMKGDTYTPTANNTLYAHWDRHVHLVTYNSNGGTTLVGEAVDYSGLSQHATVVLPTEGTGTKQTSREGFTLSEWKYTDYNDRNQSASPGASVVIYRDTTFTAQWTELQYTITYDANGGSGTIAQGTKKYWTDFTLSYGNDFTRSGFTLDSWNTKADGTGESYDKGGTYKVNSNVTLYAQWTTVPFRVTYNTNGGSPTINPVDVPHGNNASVSYNVLGSGVTSRTGFTLAGWSYVDANNSSKTANLGASVTLTKDTLFTAVWDEWTYTITYNKNGGTGTVAPTTKYYTKNATLSSGGFTRIGYVLSGWNTQANGKGTHYDLGCTTYSVNENKTLFAEWTARNYTITYNSNGGSGTIASQSMGHDGSVTLSNGSGFTRKHYKLVSWNTQANGRGTTYALGSTYNVNANVTLYAQWKWSW